VRIVPNQTPDFVEKKVVDYVKKKWAEYGSKNKMNITMGHGGRCWVSDPNNPNYLAGRKATKLVYGVEPDLTREGMKRKNSLMNEFTVISFYYIS
jgi:nonspecific dipeptidase